MIKKNQKFVTIAVLEQDIKGGIKTSSSRCPIARALKRLGYHDVSVDEYSISAGRTDKYGFYRYGLYDCPENASKFIDRFDDGKKVKPFKFIMHKR